MAIIRPSQQLLNLIDQCASQFGKLRDTVKLAKQQGIEEGFTTIEIGDMIRKKMIAAGYSRMTVSRYLSTEFKHMEKARFRNKFSNNFDLGFGNKILPNRQLPKGCQLIQGDCTQTNELAYVAANSVDLIFTDPPYNRESIPLFGKLSELAMRALKPGGSLITYFPQYALPEILELLQSSGLNYNWICYVKHGEPGNNNIPVWSNHVTVMGKPLLWLYKDKLEIGTHVPDFIQSEPPNKDLHPWAQSQVEATHFIERLTSPNEIVLDPFMGSGTTGIAASKLNRQFIGIEIDSARFETARYNLLTSQSANQNCSSKVSSFTQPPTHYDRALTLTSIIAL